MASIKIVMKERHSNLIRENGYSCPSVDRLIASCLAFQLRFEPHAFLLLGNLRVTVGAIYHSRPGPSISTKPPSFTSPGCRSSPHIVKSYRASRKHSSFHWWKEKERPLGHLKTYYIPRHHKSFSYSDHHSQSNVFRAAAKKSRRGRRWDSVPFSIATRALNSQFFLGSSIPSLPRRPDQLDR
jgi:hypothetical protein